MINTPQDYQLVTPVGVIDGGILPARDVAADGSAHAVRAEDLCFALEAVKERDFKQLAPFPSMQPSHVVDRSDWNNVWSWLRADAYGTHAFADKNVLAISPTEGFSAIPFTSGLGDTLTLPDIYPNAALASCYLADIASAVEDNKFWCRFYFDLKRADRLYVPGGSSENLGTWSASGSYADISGSTYNVAALEHGQVWAPTASTLQGVRCIGYQRPPYSSTRSRVIYGMDSTCTLERVSLPLLGRITSAVAIGSYTLLVCGAQAGATYKEYHFARSYSCTLTASGVVVDPAIFLPASSFDIVTELAAIGESFPAEATSSDTGAGYAYIRLSRTFLVADYDFRTEIRSLNWNWTP